MFENTMQGFSPFAYAFLSSAKDLILQNTIEPETEEKYDFFNIKGDIFLPLNKSFTFNDFENGTLPNFDPPGNKLTHYDDFYTFSEFVDGYLSSTITSFNVTEDLDLISILIQLSKEDAVYGVVYESKIYNKSRNNKFLFNPLHPINAFLITTGIIEIPVEGKLHIFEWKKGIVEKNLNRDITTEEKKYKDDFASTFSLLEFLLKEKIERRQTAEIREKSLKEILSYPFIDMLNAEIIVEEEQSNSANKHKNINFIIIPAQLAISGMVIPYYGVINLFKYEEEYLGMNLSPMKSGNISHSFRHDKTYPQARQEASNSVCTGSESNSTKKGWFTLSKINVGSMFFSEIIDSAAVVPYANIAKKFSGEIYETFQQEKK
jgi:hypothetical protein